MSYLPPLPPELQQVEYVQLYFHLEISAAFDLPRLGLLQLRRELHQALRTLEGWGESRDTEHLRVLLQPPLSVDPLIRRQAQKPAPAFVLTPDPQLNGLIKARQRIVLPVLFVGQGLSGMNAFISLLQQLGQQGLYHGSGQFFLEGVESEDASGVRAMLWSKGNSGAISPPVSDLNWLLERQDMAVDRVTLEVLSPLRLLRQSKPLFKADFCDLFPFILRRVSAMLTCHGAVEVITDAKYLLDAARRVEVCGNDLHWQDWRSLAKDNRDQGLGGLLGSLQLQGGGLTDILWLLQLGSLFNIGKGAPYGAGQYDLRADP